MRASLPDVNIRVKDTTEKPPGFWFWLIWVIGSGAAFTVLLIVGFTVSTMVLEIMGFEESAIEVGGPFIFYLTLAFALGGAGIGLVQWALLRKHITASWWWVVSWMVGMGLVSLISIALENVASEAVSELIHNAVAGLVVGLIHYTILRHQKEWAGLWLIAVVVSFVAAGVTAFALSTFAEDFEGASFATLVGMAISGFVMLRLLKRRPEESLLLSNRRGRERQMVKEVGSA